jgi:hypothetical protein
MPERWPGLGYARQRLTATRIGHGSMRRLMAACIG